MRKRNNIIPLHLNKKELAHLEAQVKTSGLPREEFLRTLIMGAELRAKPCEHHADLLHKVAGLCNNANQLAKVANTYGQASQQSVEEMTKLARQIWEEVKNNWGEIKLIRGRPAYYFSETKGANCVRVLPGGIYQRNLRPPPRQRHRLHPR